jgi:hypothetical protein
MKRKRWGSATASLAIACLLINSIAPANAADQIALNNENVCTGAWGSSNLQWQGPASRFTIPGATTITKATLSYALLSPNGSSSYTSQTIVFWTNSGSLPGTKLGTLSPVSYSGLQATFTGSVALASAGTYWMQIQNTNGSQFCYQNTVNNTGSSAGWSTQVGIAYGSSGSGTTPTAFTAFGTPQSAYQFVYSLYTPGIETVSATAAEYLKAPKGVVDTLTATTSTSGRLTFFANGKKIANCINLAVASTSRTCLWRPTVTGSARIFVNFTPAGGSMVTSTPILVKVINRSNLR